jgi:hypothetical protein
MLSAGFVAEALGKDSVTAAQAAQNAAENNFLTAKQLVEVDEALQACEAMANPDICKVQVVETARNLSRKQDFALAVAKIKCFVGLCSTLKDLNARIAEGNDPQSVSKLLTDKNPSWSQEYVQTATDYYRQGALDSLEDSSGRVIDSTLYFATATGSVVTALSAGTKTLVNSSAGQGGLNLFKWGEKQTTTATAWQNGDYMLFLPNQGGTAANWAQNSSRLRELMREGKPIYDSYRDAVTGMQIPTRGFLNAERNLLKSHGWQYNPQTGAYHPPGQ